MNYRSSFLCKCSCFTLLFAALISVPCVFLLKILTGLLLTLLPKIEILLLLALEYEEPSSGNLVLQAIIIASVVWTLLQGCWHVYSFLLSNLKNAIKHQVISIQLRALGNLDLFALLIAFALLNRAQAFGTGGSVEAESLLLLSIGAFTEQLRGTVTLVNKDLYQEVLLSACRALGQTIGSGVLPEQRNVDKSETVQGLHQTMEDTINGAISQIEAGAASMLPPGFAQTIASLSGYDELRNTVKDAALETGKDYIPENVTYALAAFDDLNSQYEEYLKVERKGLWARRLSVFVLVLSFTAVMVVALV